MIFQMTAKLFWLIISMCGLKTSMVALERIKEYNEIEHEASWLAPHTDKILPENWPNKGEIIFRDFEMRYQKDLQPVLKGVNFRVDGGEKVGIVGRTGAGKSSLTLSLFRILECTGGGISIDGIDISKLGLHTLRGRLTIIPQVSFTKFLLDLVGMLIGLPMWKF